MYILPHSTHYDRTAFCAILRTQQDFIPYQFHSIKVFMSEEKGTTPGNGKTRAIDSGKHIPRMPVMQVYSQGEVQKLTGRHHEILRLYALGIPRHKIASVIGITEPTVTNIISSELGKRELLALYLEQDEKTLDAKTVILANQTAAANVMVDALKAETTTKNVPDWRVRLDAANKILNKGEHPDKKLEISRTEIEETVKVKIEKIKEIASRAGALTEAEEIPYKDVSGTDIPKVAEG